MLMPTGCIFEQRFHWRPTGRRTWMLNLSGQAGLCCHKVPTTWQPPLLVTSSRFTCHSSYKPGSGQLQLCSRRLQSRDRWSSLCLGHLWSRGRGKRETMNHVLAFKASAEKWHISRPPTFNWLKQVDGRGRNTTKGRQNLVNSNTISQSHWIAVFETSKSSQFP